MKASDQYGSLLDRLGELHPGWSKPWLLNRVWLERFLERLWWVAGRGTFVLAGGYATELHCREPRAVVGIDAVCLTGDATHTHRLLRTAADVRLGDPLRFAVRSTGTVAYPDCTANTWSVTPIWHDAAQTPFPFTVWPARNWHHGKPDVLQPLVRWPDAVLRENRGFEVLDRATLLAEYGHCLLAREADDSLPVTVHELHDFVLLESRRPHVSAGMLQGLGSGVYRHTGQERFQKLLLQVAEERGTPESRQYGWRVMEDWREAFGFIAGVTAKPRREKLLRQALRLLRSLHEVKHVPVRDWPPVRPREHDGPPAGSQARPRHDIVEVLEASHRKGCLSSQVLRDRQGKG